MVSALSAGIYFSGLNQGLDKHTTQDEAIHVTVPKESHATERNLSVPAANVIVSNVSTEVMMFEWPSNTTFSSDNLDRNIEDRTMVIHLFIIWTWTLILAAMLFIGLDTKKKSILRFCRLSRQPATPNTSR